MTAPHVDGSLLDELLQVATTATERAAALQVEGLAVARAEIATKSTSTDMVTEIDRSSEALIVRTIHDARPDDGVLGEEGSQEAGTSGVRWVIDPLDGTTNYLYGHPGFAVSVAAEVDGAGVVGVVNDPLHGDVFQASVGRGAFRNGIPIRRSDHADVATALVATGFAYDPGRRRRQAQVVASILGEIRDIRRMGAASVDLCSVACGRVDAYYERGLGPWDWAAGLLIATEAGAQVGGLDGGPPTAGSVLAAPPALFEALLALLSAAGAAKA
ncbi:MAG: inositol monophosphatase family protein [Acidimicrobiales bacterium]